MRQELFGVVEDEDALDVELQAPGRVTVPQVEGCVAGNVQERRVLALALDAIVAQASGSPESWAMCL